MNILSLTLLVLFFTFSLISAEKALKPEQYPFSFSKPLGKIDKNSAQRGLQVYIEVCASCHGLKHVAYRNLEGLGYNKDQINAIASQFELDDFPNDEGEIIKRKAIYSSRKIKYIYDNDPER